MKKNSINLTNLFQLLLIVILIILGTTKLNAQLKVGSNPQQLAPNALLEIESNIGKVAVFTKDSAFLGLGTLSPTRRLEIQNGNSPGAIKIVDGTQGAGKILTSDANGVGTWSNPFIATPQNITNSNGIIVYGGIGAALVATALRLDSMVVAKMLGQSPVKDSLSSVVSNIITSGSVTGQNTTAGNLIIVTNGTGASLKSMTVSTDTSALKTFIAKNVGTSPIKDSLAKTLGQSPVKDSLSSVVSSIITTGSVTGQNTTAGNLIIVTNGTGASLKSMTVSTDTTALKTFIAKNVGASPIKDSIKSIVTNQLQNSYIVTNIAGVIPALSLGDAGSISLTVLGAAIGNNVVVNPTTDLPFGIVIAYSRVIAPNTIKIGFVGTGSVAAHATSFDIRVFN